MRTLRVAMFGTPAFAVPTLETLLASPHVVAGVVTQPDRPRGRGQHVSAGPVKTVALAHGLPVLQPGRLKPELFAADFAALDADIAVVAAYGKLLPAWLLAEPRLGFINVHASLLPKYRGASPVHHAVMSGDQETGVTIMRVVLALDAGPMIARRRLPIGPEDTAAAIEQRLSALGAALLLETMDRLAVGPVIETPQDDAQASYAPRLTKAMGLVDWSKPASVIHHQIRGLTPWPLAYTFVRGSRVILRRSHLAEGDAGGSQPGAIARLASGVAVVCGDGRLLEVVELQLEGKRPMSGHDAVAGRVLVAGEGFDPP